VRLRIAIVGTGNVARKNYLPFLAQQADCELGYFNRTRAKAEECAQMFGGWAADSLDQLMSQTWDTVLLLTHESARYDLAQQVLQHRPPRIFFEKPLVAQQDQANVTEGDFTKGRELLTLAQAQGTETAMVFNYRFFDQTLLARDIVQQRDWGQLIHAAGFVHYACWSHSIDLIHLFGGPIAELTALPGSIEHQAMKMKAHDVTAAFTTVNGAAGTIIGTNGTDFSFPLFELLLSFERGRLTLCDLDGDMEVLDYGGQHHQTMRLTRATSRWDQYNRSFDKALDAYLNSLRAGSPPPVPGLAGLQELQFEAAIKRSIRLRRPVKVQEEFPLDGDQ
jgi:predicted dehydrogenase